MKEEKPEPQPQSNRIRIGLIIGSVILGVILALFSIMTAPQ